ncbi:MAG: polysaccharide biosynthesis tyrosine autokinase [Tetrasphaera sp.]
MTVREFLGILARRWLIVLATFVLVLGVAVYVTSRIVPSYASSARVYFSAAQQVVVPATDPDKKPTTATQSTALTNQDLVTYTEILHSPAILDELRSRVGLPPGSGIDVNATVGETSNVMTFDVRAASAEQAATIANEAGPALAEAGKKFAPLLSNPGATITAVVVSPAGVPGGPVSPNWMRNLLLGAFTGVALGVGLALLRHAADTKIRDDEHITAISDRPILGHLPLVRSGTPAELNVDNDPLGPYAEAMRRLRTNVRYVDVTTRGHAFVLTSPVPREGKTTTVVNLARAMAQSGIRVLLIDADLRKPTIHKHLGIEGKAGLTSILVGAATPEDVIHDSPDSSLSVLAAGDVPPNPSELLGSEAMSSLFGDLAGRYDFILVDAPPLVPVIDAVLLQRLTRGLIMVVAVDHTRRRDLESAITSLETVGAHAAGFAVNMSGTPSESRYRYRYYGYGQRQSKSRHGKRRSLLPGRRSSTERAQPELTPIALEAAPPLRAADSVADPRDVQAASIGTSERES